MEIIELLLKITSFLMNEGGKKNLVEMLGDFF